MKEMTRRSFLALSGATAVAAAGLGLVGCGSSSSDSSSSSDPSSDSSKQLSGTVTAAGSTALQPLVEAAAEQFADVQPGIQVSVQGGGSGQGITQIVQGTVQIGNSDVFAEEKVSSSDDLAKIKDNKVCVVGMGPVVNPDLGVTDISMDTLKGIFTGSITNWKDAGGPDQEIVVINRASGSGTRATFEANVLKGKKAPDSFKPQEQDSSGTVASMVAQTPGSISYLAFSYFDDSMGTPSVDGVEPKEENVESGDWKIWAYEHMYTAANPDEATQAFIDYMMGDDVQGSLIESNGYIPMSGMKVERDAQGNETSVK